MEIPQSVAHATVVDCSRVNSTCSSLSWDTFIPPNEHTPLLSHSNSFEDRRNATALDFYIKECLNWRTIGLFVMFISGLAVATYLLWRETTDFLEIGYRLSLTQHDIWSRIHLEGLSMLEAGKVVNVYMTHTGSAECTENCAQLLHTLQDNLKELPYNFLMAGDCEAYEVRGWRYVSDYGTVPQQSSLVFGFVGDFTVRLPSSCQLEMAAALLREAQRRRRLQPVYQLFALRNTSRSELDADALQQQLKLWPLYAGVKSN